MQRVFPCLLQSITPLLLDKHRFLFLIEGCFAGFVVLRQSHLHRFRFPGPLPSFLSNFPFCRPLSCLAPLFHFVELPSFSFPLNLPFLKAPPGEPPSFSFPITPSAVLHLARAKVSSPLPFTSSGSKRLVRFGGAASLPSFLF